MLVSDGETGRFARARSSYPLEATGSPHLEVVAVCEDYNSICMAYAQNATLVAGGAALPFERHRLMSAGAAAPLALENLRLTHACVGVHKDI